MWARVSNMWENGINEHSKYFKSIAWKLINSYKNRYFEGQWASRLKSGHRRAVRKARKRSHIWACEHSLKCLTAKRGPPISCSCGGPRVTPGSTYPYPRTRTCTRTRPSRRAHARVVIVSIARGRGWVSRLEGNGKGTGTGRRGQHKLIIAVRPGQRDSPTCLRGEGHAQTVTVAVAIARWPDTLPRGALPSRSPWAGSCSRICKLFYV